jgi:hypothetical protein
MKTIGEFRFPLLVLTGSMIIILFTSYGNKKVHPDLNTMMVDAFLKKNNMGDFSQQDFKRYMFYFDASATLAGTAIIKEGLFSDMDVTAAGMGFGTKLSSEGPAEMTPLKWISIGGLSADVPEVPASLRHFYDPTRAAGDRYLTDITNAKIMGSLQKYVLTNPRIDGVEWALGKAGDISEGVQDHKYTWEHGKIWMQMALKEANQDKKNGYMAGAWRSLGETLHMIADNGCPPHVRNDAHPSPLWGNNTWFGNPDPYEELIDIIRRDEPGLFGSFADGSPDPGLKNSFDKMTKAADVANALAVFTNSGFVTNETISGIDKYGNTIKQVIHPEYSYSSPLLETMTYNENEYAYSSASGIKQCVDHYYFAKLIPKLCDPYVDNECVKSQAKVLIPNLIEAGKKVIGLYIPKLSVEIKSIDKDLLKGEIIHKTDQEYPNEIKYTGEVKLLVKDKNSRELKKMKTLAKDGVFEEKGIELSKDETIQAIIEFGGVTVESPEFLGIDNTKDIRNNIVGTYKGKYALTVTESTLLRKNMDKISPNATGETRMAGESMARMTTDTEMGNIKWLLGGGKGELSVIFIIYDARKPTGSFAPTKNAYFVQSGGNTVYLPFFLSQTTDASLGKVTGNYSNSGFSVQVEVEGEKLTYEVTASFSGKDLNGNWTCSYKGTNLAVGSFSTVKISD